MNKAAQFRYDHSLGYFHAAGERGFVITFALALLVIPNLAIGTLAIPAKVSVRNRIQR